MDYAKESLRLHGEWKGKIEMVFHVQGAGKSRSPKGDNKWITQKKLCGSTVSGRAKSRSFPAYPSMTAMIFLLPIRPALRSRVSRSRRI